ncbi:HNH endonuclease signature motif containing protein, partial [Nesterenkonia muleiensis]|uniref:HNH endonuclease signature motif containing protein n=1 Tax=Nesterenkonia muleiensis TaxID=2282648 RepID=UPI0013006BC8
MKNGACDPLSPVPVPVPQPPVSVSPRPDPVVVSQPRSPQRLLEHLGHLAGAPELAAAWEDQVIARCAEARVLGRLLDYRARIQHQVAGEHLFARAAADKAAIHHAAQLLGLGDRTAVIILNAAGFIRDELPMTWQSFHTGVIDLPRIRRIAEAATAITERHQLEILDADVAQIAPEKTPTELKHWLTRRIPELDTEAYDQRCQAAAARRYVRIEHLSEGLSFLEALIPTTEAAVIEKRLSTAARSMHQPQPADTEEGYQPTTGTHDADAGAGVDTEDTGESQDTGSESHPTGDQPLGDHPTSDDRTLAQKEADLLSAWLRTGITYGATVEAKICVLIPETTLTGDTNQPATGADRSWVIPAAQARKLATDQLAEHQWYSAEARKNTREADHDILRVVYTGRFAPDRLRDAVIFRDGVCQTPGCTTPAERADLDHQHPYDHGGTTTGANIWALCRRHHTMKSHGYLPT